MAVKAKMSLSRVDEKTLREALGGTYGGPSISFEEGEWVLYSWSDAPVGMDTHARGKTLAELARSIRSPVTRGEKVPWVAPKNARRGEVFTIRLADDRVHEARCVSVDHRPGGGAGMGEHGESWLANFTDGMVLSFDAWAEKGVHWRVIAEPFEKEGGDDEGR